MVASWRGGVAVCVLAVVAAHSSLAAADELLRVSTERRIERRHRSGVGQLLSGVALTVAGAVMLGTYPICSGNGLTPGEQNCVGLLPAGGVVAAVGLPLLTSGALLMSDARRARQRLSGSIDPLDPASGRLQLLTRSELDRERRRSAGLAIGSGIGHVLSIGTVVVGMSLSLFARELSGIDAHPSDATARARDAYSDAGVSLMIIGGIAYGPTATLSIASVVRWLRLRQIAHGPLTESDLQAQRASTRRRVLGGAISAALCVGLVGAGAGLLVDGGPRTDGGTLLQPADQAEQAAGLAMISIASAGVVASVAVLGSGLARRRRLVSAQPDPTTAHALRVLPWMTRDAGGLRLAGSF
jgi:hypothetical protein